MQAKFATVASLLMLAGNGVAKPVNGVEKRQLGGLGQILSDHVKYVSDPPSALQPIPASQNSPAREAHLSVHAALFEAFGGGAAHGRGAAKGRGAANANPVGGLFGGNAAGGRTADGSAADESAAGDSTVGDSTAGGSAAGGITSSGNLAGSTAGGSTAGGITSNGNLAGSTAGGIASSSNLAGNNTTSGKTKGKNRS